MMTYTGRIIPEEFCKVLEAELRLVGHVSHYRPRQKGGTYEGEERITHFVSNGNYTRAYCGEFCPSNLEPVGRGTFKFCNSCIIWLVRSLERDGVSIAGLTELGKID